MLAASLPSAVARRPVKNVFFTETSALRASRSRADGDSSHRGLGEDTDAFHGCWDDFSPSSGTLLAKERSKSKGQKKPKTLHVEK